MILLELEIEDYKQFRGRHSFAPGPNGVVAIIGPNGAGKTTLFEAIEWCLFQPREIRNDEIPPRSAPEARPRVRVRLASPSGPIWEVERSLKKTGASAEVRKLTDEGREIIASGSTQVTSYVASKLIGLEHKAFVATFFTRQKELSFFGSLKPTDRRREVGRLLGLETIREAQQIIGDERTLKKNTANALRAQYEHESGSRDFDSERKERNERLIEIDGQIATASVALQKAEQDFAKASARRAELVEQREANLKLQTELERQRSIIATAQATITAARNELAKLDSLEAERPGLLECASKLADLDERVAALEVARERAQRLASLLEQKQQAQAEVVRLVGDARRQLRAIPFPQYSPLTVTAIEEFDPVSALDQILCETSTVKSSRTDELVTALHEIQAEQAALADNEAKLQQYTILLAELERESARAAADGDPAEAEQREVERRDSALRDMAAHRASIKSLERTIIDYEQLMSRPVVATAEAICTMCGRPISEHEVADIKRHAQARCREIESDIRRLRGEIARHERVCMEAEEAIRKHRERALELEKLSGRIQNGLQRVEEQRRTVDSTRYSLVAHMTALGRTTAVTEDELEQLQERLTCERAIEALVTTFGQIRTSLTSQLDRVDGLTAQISELGVVTFDRGDLTAAQRARDEARTATDRLLFIDAQAAHRPEHERAIAESETSRAVASEQTSALEAKLAERPIDEFALEEIEDELEELSQAKDRHRALRENHQRERITIQTDLKQIDKDEERLAETIKRAEQARVEADDLDRMYAEFNDFERFVARRVRPQLEDMTSELVRVVTENKYESVVLDDDYGVKVYDGILGPYPIEHYSGGERDVVALAARLALSRLIGSQAANPPSFLVLDEVFGSLDRDRRANLLDLLGSLAGSAESFQQLFVISHVDDVRVSAAFNEVWRVVEQPDGSSLLENLNATQAAEDF